MKSWVFAMMVVAAGSLVACSSSDGSGGNGGSGGDGGSGANGGSGGSGGSGGNTATTGTGTTGTTAGTTTTTTQAQLTCADEADFETCAECCSTEEQPDAYDVLLNYAVEACACTSEAASPCYAQCTDICSGSQPGQECITCLNTEFGKSQSACVSSAFQQCGADSTCSPWIECAQGCPQ